MEKNWLIRTQNQKILGPVSKTKIIELVQKKSLGNDDEICPGNGHWFFLREKDLVDQYVWGDLPSSFNPVSEAPSFISGKDQFFVESYLKQIEKVKTISRGSAPTPAVDSTQVKNLNDFKSALQDEKNKQAQEEEIEDDNIELLPDSADLEYPDFNDLKTSAPDMPATSSVASTPIKKAAPSLVEVHDEEELEVKMPDSSDLEYPDMDVGPSHPPEPEPPTPPPVSLELLEKSKSPAKEVEKKKVVPLPPTRHPIKKPVVAPPVASAPAIPSSAPTASSAPKIQVKVEDKASVKPIDPMMLLQLSKTAERPVAPTRRNDLILIILFVVILGVIGMLFYQYKQMVRKTVTTKHVVKEMSKKQELPAQEPTEAETPSPLLPTEGSQQ